MNKDGVELMDIHLNPGVLSPDQMRSLITAGVIRDFAGNSEDIDGSSIDLHLGDRLYQMKGSIKGTSSDQYAKVLMKYKESDRVLDENGSRLEVKKTYVIRISESLNLSKGVYLYRYATAKSSIGRLDVLVRMIADYSDRFDEFPSPETLPHGTASVDLYAEITPLTFPIIVYRGNSVNQLRFIWGSPELSLIPTSHLKYYGRIMSDDSNPDQLSVNLSPADFGNGIKIPAFRAKKDTNIPIDLNSKEGSIDPRQFWVPEPVVDRIMLEIRPEEFYIIRSKGRFTVPENVAVYARAMTESLGELRIHYAGFVHPGFGRKQEQGTPLIFEVRGHNVTTFLRDGETLANLQYFRMSEPTQGKSPYDKQELKLSKYFRDWS